MKSFASIAFTIILIGGGFLFSYLYRQHARTLGYGDETLATLAEENKNLTAQVELLKAQFCADDTHSTSIRAGVYAEYPWNNQELLVLDKGSDEHIAVGMPVLSESGFAVGVVIKVHASTAEVQTIFDAAWKSSVAIGTKGVKAVLSGGAAPQLSLIPENAGIAPGDSVVSVSPLLPLYAPIGSVDAVEGNGETVWESASVSVPYQEGDLTSVLVRTNFP